MKKHWIVALWSMAAFLSVMMVLSLLKEDRRTEYVENYQHEMNADADSSIGPVTLPEGYILGDDFVTHLPLVIIDLQGNEMRNIYSVSVDGTTIGYSPDGMQNPDPWVNMSVSIINNENKENHLTDEPELINEGKIKLRGMSSRNFPKKQYGIKLMDGDAELELPVLGMEADEDWVLSNSFLDMSGIRNYLALNIGRQIFKYTSEVRFCEVVFKDEDVYTYQGLYLLEEKIKQAKGRIDIQDYDEDAVSLSYVICRDRYNETGLMLSTWASDEQICYGYFSMVYPKEELLSEEAIATIEAELSQIEYCLYSDEPQEFQKYRDYLDVDSFVDYFIFNEFFANYDAGDNSTYYYKTSDGKLAIGPLWDYDGALDNYRSAASYLEYAVFFEQPWFERLILDADFQNKVIARYEELRDSYLSEEYIFDFIDDTMSYLGNASVRNDFRWRTSYESGWELRTLENGEGILIDRTTETVEEEIQRIKDIILIHGNWMDEHFEDELTQRSSEELSEAGEFNKNYIAIGGIYAFVLIIILLLRVMKGEYQ